MPKAINISAAEAKEITELPNNTVLISINNTFREVFPLKLDRNSSKILTVIFDDVTVTGPAKYPNGEIQTKKVIDTKTVLKILDFININRGKNFYIHCHAGVSRSAAICMYLHLMEGYELRKDFWEISNSEFWPNPLVLGRLIIERKRK